MTRILSSLCLLGCLTIPIFANAQGAGSALTGQDTVGYRIPQSAVPFLNFTPDARSAGIGDAGVATSPDANSLYWNPSKLVFAKQDQGVALSYTPWLRNIADDMYFTYLSGYKKVGRNQVIGLSLLYFDMGTIDFTTILGQPAGSFNSKEYAVTASYSRRLAQNFSMGVNLKYINSNLSGNYSVNGMSLKPASTAAVDISAYYHNEVRDDVTGQGYRWAFGGIISNIGGKVSYGTPERSPLPTNFKIGTALTLYTDKYNKFNFALDLNKLMVPTPPVYQTVNGVPVINPTTGQYTIVQGKDPNRSTFQSIFGSFADAPGGFSEELKEINIATGIEYWYNDLFAARLGYYNEAKSKGDRKFATAGLGIRLQQKYGIDFAYLIPVRQGNPLAQTFRISLIIDINKKARSAEVDDSDDNDNQE